jgi:hypothetical protein
MAFQRKAPGTASPCVKLMKSSFLEASSVSHHKGRVAQLAEQLTLNQ